MEDKTHSGKSEIVSFSAPRDPKHRQISFGKFSKNHGESQPRRHSHHSCQPPQPPQPPQLPHLAAQLPQLHTGRPEPCNARLTNMKLSSNFIRAESSHHLQPPMCTQRDEGYIYIYVYVYIYICICMVDDLNSFVCALPFLAEKSLLRGSLANPMFFFLVVYCLHIMDISHSCVSKDNIHKRMFRQSPDSGGSSKETLNLGGRYPTNKKQLGTALVTQGYILTTDIFTREKSLTCGTKTKMQLSQTHFLFPFSFS